MPRRLICFPLVALAIVGTAACSGTGTARPVVATSSPADDSPVGVYNIPADDIAKLGLPLQPVPADRGVLQGPGYRFALKQLGTTGEFSPQQVLTLIPWARSPSPVKADTGNEYLVAAIETWGLVRPDADAIFHIAGRDFHEQIVGTVLVVEVPTGAPIGLDITAAGRTQKMDLRTGQTSDLIDGYYPVRSAVESMSTSVRVTQAGVDLRYTPLNAFSVSADIDAALVPWTKAEEWAPAGRRWLVVKLFVSVSVLDPVTVDVDLGHDLVLTGPAGRLPLDGTATVTGSATPGTGSRQRLERVYDVPAGTGSISGAFTFTGKVSYDGKPVRWSNLGNGTPKATLTFQ
jgi:hypothetical protein